MKTDHRPSRRISNRAFCRIAVHAPLLAAHVFFALPFSLVAAQDNGNEDVDGRMTRLATDVQRHCADCHGQDGPEAGLDLTQLKSNLAKQAKADLLQKILKAVADKRMPPPDDAELADRERQRMLSDLNAVFQFAVSQQPFPPVSIRRMNRFQYNNAVVDLLELQRDIFQLNERLMRRRSDYFDPASGKMPDQVRVSCRPLSKDIDNQRPEGFRGVAAFPQDKRAEHGFDNQADHISLSPLLMESYLKLSQSITDSPDLNAKECGTWNRLFLPPEQASELKPAGMKEILQQRLGWLLRRAFRRPVDNATRDSFVRFAQQEMKNGADFERAMRTTVGAILAMPEFFYLHESAVETPENVDQSLQDQSPHVRVNDFELAGRLAQFFWSSIPDDELLDLAQAGKLGQPEVLSKQIDRMLKDRKIARFCDNFPAQWLQLDRLITAVPDQKKFPWFYYNGYRTSMHMMSEPLLLFETVLIEDRPVMDLVQPDFSYRSSMLQTNYEGKATGARDVQVQTFRRVKIKNPRQGGVITNMAVMTMTSTPVRTQPITRGAWINEVIFNDPPEPPPADVPPLPKANTAELEKLTIRERLAIHRKRADCAACHDQIDPLGFALENYGPTGVWRDVYDNGRNVDVSGKLFNQYPFKTVEEFKQIISVERQRFIRAFAGHLLTYALGRKTVAVDSPALDEITKRAVAGEDSLRTIMKNIALSEPFLSKR